MFNILQLSSYNGFFKLFVSFVTLFLYLSVSLLEALFLYALFFYLVSPTYSISIYSHLFFYLLFVSPTYSMNSHLFLLTIYVPTYSSCSDSGSQSF